jgi:ADP-ribose pyrophosphatase
MRPLPIVTAVRKLAEARFLSLFEAEVKDGDTTRRWTFASRKRRPLEGPAHPDAVVIVPFVASADGWRLLVTREFRPPLARLASDPHQPPGSGIEIGVPAGLLDAGETVEGAAIRELREETGLGVLRVLHVSPLLASSPGAIDETTKMVFVEAAGDLSVSQQVGGEHIHPLLVDFAGLQSLIAGANGQVFSSRLYPLIVGFLTAGKISPPNG